MLYRCVAKCWELDYNNEPHCQRKNIDDLFDKFGYDCPCGNNPVWEVVEEE